MVAIKLTELLGGDVGVTGFSSLSSITAATVANVKSNLWAHSCVYWCKVSSLKHFHHWQLCGIAIQLFTVAQLLLGWLWKIRMTWNIFRNSPICGSGKVILQQLHPQLLQVSQCPWLRQGTAHFPFSFVLSASFNLSKIKICKIFFFPSYINWVALYQNGVLF